MKEKTIHRIILGAVFILALILFSVFINRGSTNMTADMGAATLPTISFEEGDYKINLLAGHTEEMSISGVRDTITPVGEDGNLKVHIQTYEREILKASFQVCSLDGENTLWESAEDISSKEEEITLILAVGEHLEEGEALLKITLSLEDDSEVFYYTRVLLREGLSFDQCLAYALSLHDAMFDKTNTQEVEEVLETGTQSDNTTLSHVTIYSDLEHATWGDLKPQVLGDIQVSVKETKASYTSLLLRYRVKCDGDSQGEIYDVNEFFRVRNADGSLYLLTYDRTLEEEFTGTGAILKSEGINLGMADQSLSYKTNEDGTVVAFIQAGELWSYDAQEEEYALIFSFADSEKEDVRNRIPDHSIRILSMNDEGNVTFAVYGYMNRGTHEGKSGAAIYYFDSSKNVVEEKAFIPRCDSYAAIEKELGGFAYYNDETNVLYVMLGDTLYQVDLENHESEVLLSSMESDCFVTSDDGALLAYQTPDDAGKAVVMNFESGKKQTVTAGEGEILCPLGFLMGDFVYGTAISTDAGQTTAGKEVLGMYKLEIRDSKNQVVKTYQAEGSYVLGVKIQSNMMTLNLAVKNGETYSESFEDYITNNEENSGGVTLKSYWSDRKETQYRLSFESSTESKKTKVLKPKQVLTEEIFTLETEDTDANEWYSVYGLGTITGVYEDAGEAVCAAKEVSGVVVSSKQNCIWEDGNRVSWYRNFEMSAFAATSSETALAASVRAVLAYEGMTVDAAAEMGEKSALAVLDAYLEKEAIYFTGCSVGDMRYLIDKGTPVIGLTGNGGALVFVGYDAKTVTYIDPAGGGVRSAAIETIDALMSGSGNTFLGYVH